MSTQEQVGTLPQDFYRIRRLPPYVFAEIADLKATAIKEGRDIIDFGMGNPDTPPAQHIIDTLIESARSEKNHGYSSSQGIPLLRDSLVGYYKRRFDVDINPEDEAIVTLGSKEGIASLAKAITSPGDMIFVPNPCYPIHTYGFILADASVKHIPNNESQSTLVRQVKEEIELSKPKPLALVLNYPCNPTAETVTLEFYEEMVDLCRHYGVYIISDLAYCELYYDDNPPPSILQTKYGRDVAIEFTSISKSFSMAGWRMGFAVGNKRLISALKHIKSYLDYGAFTPIQVAAAEALNSPTSELDALRDIYRARRDLMVSGLHKLGWNVSSPNATMFIWAKIPDKFLHMKSMKFSKLLLDKADIAVAPGIGFGPYGDEHVRIALVQDENRIRKALIKLKAVFTE
jgi:alanine-synthesizing transaminase